MKNFISVHDIVTESNSNAGAAIDALVAKALAYKVNPFMDRKLGADKRIGLLIDYINLTFLLSIRNTHATHNYIRSGFGYTNFCRVRTYGNYGKQTIIGGL